MRKIMDISQSCVDAMAAKDLDKLAEFNDELTSTIQTMRDWATTMPVAKLEKLYRAEKEERLLELPIKLGAFVYLIKNENGEKVIRRSPVKTVNIVGETLCEIILDKGKVIMAEQLGELAYLTYAEAKKAWDSEAQK